MDHSVNKRPAKYIGRNFTEYETSEEGVSAGKVLSPLQSSLVQEKEGEYHACHQVE